MDPIQKYTDLTYGALLLLGMIMIMLFSHVLFFVGAGVGLFIGYVVHVGSEMVKFNSRMDEVKDAAEQAAEETKEAKQAVEQTQETVEKVEETTESVADNVESAVNGDE